MMNIKENILELKKNLPEGVKLVAVSKNNTPEVIMEAYEAGHKIFGENRVQELTQKIEPLPKDIEWHFIGHLQSNKVKFIAPFVSMIHGVDSFKLLNVINREAKKSNRNIPCLLQFHIAEESSKFGFTKEEVMEELDNNRLDGLTNITISGVMGMATFSSDVALIRSEFRTLKEIFEELKRGVFSENSEFREISMGMSEDYHIAIEEGSTIVRLGSKIFG